MYIFEYYSMLQYTLDELIVHQSLVTDFKNLNSIIIILL